MRIEIPVFDGVDEIDVFGPFEVLAGSGFEVELVGVEAPGRIVTQRGVRLETGAALGAPEALIVPGGGWLNRSPEGAYAQAQRKTLPRKLAELAPSVSFIASVCTGSMLLAHAGLLEHRHATTNRNVLDELRAHGAHVVEERVVDDGTIITAGGLTAGIDLGLHIVERELGTEAADRRAHAIEYERQGRTWYAPPR